MRMLKAEARDGTEKQKANFRTTIRKIEPLEA